MPTQAQLDRNTRRRKLSNKLPVSIAYNLMILKIDRLERRLENLERAKAPHKRKKLTAAAAISGRDFWGMDLQAPIQKHG